jgi:hypothetical protein
MNSFAFCVEFYGVENTKSWDSGTFFVGGSACVRKFVTEIE